MERSTKTPLPTRAARTASTACTASTARTRAFAIILALSLALALALALTPAFSPKVALAEAAEVAGSPDDVSQAQTGSAAIATSGAERAQAENPIAAGMGNAVGELQAALDTFAHEVYEKQAADRVEAEREAVQAAAVESAAQTARAQSQSTENDGASDTPDSSNATGSSAANSGTEGSSEAASTPTTCCVISINGTSMGYVGSYKTSSAPASGAGLWLGSDSTTDGSWGYFIGHNPGSFSCVMSLGVGSPVTVWDSEGASRTYSVVTTFTVPDTTYWEDIAERVTGYGESVILQTCVGDGASYRIVVAA